MRDIWIIAAEFDSLGVGDFDWGKTGEQRLQCLCDELLERNDPAVSAPILFGLMERLDTADLGSPGPLVHTLESWPGRYEAYLAGSIRRKPSALAVWMVNRILNVNPPDRENWLALLQSVAVHPLSSATAKEQAVYFLEYQSDPVKRSI